MSDDKKESSQKVVAYVLIAIACYVVLVNTGFLEAIGLRNVVRSLISLFFDLIPVGFIGVGVYWLNHSEQTKKPMMAWFLIGFGIVALTSQFGWFGLSTGSLYLPMWLVFVAVVILNPKKIFPKAFNVRSGDVNEETTSLRLFALMGGGELNYTTKHLSGGEITAIMGGYKIDLSKADMEGSTIELQLLCFMGGVEIIVPPNWEVEKQAVCIMGGFSDKSRCLAEELNLPRKRLIINGFALMGGGEINN